MSSDNFKFQNPFQVAIRDVNYGGHVGNDVYLSYYQEARIAYLNNLGFSEMDIGGNGIILVKAEVDFKAELFHGDKMKLCAKISSIKNTSFIMEYLIEKEDGTIASVGKTVLVSFDYGKRSISRVPSLFKERVSEYEGL